ncbi:cellulose biosynthesis cyclic di-GMP-binding regulatory protein BcsB [Aureimonas mangrovi]|uniref:cellulose biosynthesis cyclic di-GMP-binding regulatory protein BcsB n=1 Tax=Aureimonas mangrovi TaxID=2758041 RepID=UPI00163D6746|nr:cellulose biosynthesis cyclic di-GMP-binding regulatory protein BcsB [Aureimonas mangrovi]
MKRSVILALTALLSAGSASVWAQPAPFDMTPEEDAEPAAPQPSQSPSTGPAETAPEPQNDDPQGGQADSGPVEDPGEPTVVRGGSEAPIDPVTRRYVVPGNALTLSGEVAERRWSVYLTPEQASSAATLQFGYQNSILAAPETSRLSVVLNGTVLAELPPASPDAVADVVLDVPAGLLREGANVLSFASRLRHRTDCTVESTYDLWVEIDPERTFLDFGDEDAMTLRRLDDLRAVGLASDGATRLQIVVPGGSLTQAAGPLVRLSQGLALLAGMPNQSVTINEGDLPPRGAGRLTVLAGPESALSSLLENAEQTRPDGSASPGFVQLPDGRTALLVSGQDWREVGEAVERVVAPTDRPISVERTELSTPNWRTPDTPLVVGESTLRLSDLGVATQEFSGRRFRTEFTVGVPADFYAESYGEASFILDAAYSPAVLPGSHIDIYVNGNIATTVPIGSNEGAVLRNNPVGLTLRHFRPGVNTLAIEAILDTQADEACLPGTTSDDTNRFALFDSSRLVMPNFARISQRPNLAATAGTGYPYNRSPDPVPLILGEISPSALSAASTFLSRLALVAGRPITVETGVSAVNAAAHDALFVGAASRLPAGVLNEIGVSETLRSGWELDQNAPQTSGTQASMEGWSDRVGSRWQQPLLAVDAWLEERFDLSTEMLSLRRRAEGNYVPPAQTSLLVAQGSDPTDERVWTVLTAPDAEALAQGVDTLTRQENWSELTGGVTLYQAGENAFFQVPAQVTSLAPTQPTSLRNLRLVTANWLSENVLFYALLLALVSLVLGIMTTLFTSVLGRRQ